MNNPVKDPLDELFSSLNDLVQESPSPAFVQDLEARLDALEKKRRKPLLIPIFCFSPIMQQTKGNSTPRIRTIPQLRP
ncbi:MAG: hypothetical protein LW804_05415 [Cryomorphaceae bacterium]|nr:hypothetical protein [Cryomorphaceae bacterium]